MSHKTALKVYAALTLIVGSWVPAMAGTDGKVLPGAACVATYAHYNAYTSYEKASATNDSDTMTASYTCPVVKDIVGGSINRALVRVVDQNFSHNVTCELWTYAADGTSGRWAERSSSGTNPAPQLLTFGALGTPYAGFSYITCRLPPRYSGVPSKIISYQVDENE